MTNEIGESVSIDSKPAKRPEPERDMVALACRALRLLGKSGQAAEAGAIGGNMWWTVKDQDPEGAQMLDRVMHFLARLDTAEDTSEGTGSAPSDEPELDAQALDPSIRHARIAETFEALPAGGGFILVNTHDPKPLRYQFDGKYGDTFTWDYLQSGPEIWKIRIGRPS